MITLVIYGVIAIALAASAGYAFLSFSSSSRQLTQLQENQVRLDTATAALRSSLLALSSDGVSYAPYGTPGTAPNAYMQLPTTLGVVGAAPWGQPYLYCPVSQTGASNTRATPNTGNNPVVQSPGSAYGVGLYSSNLTQGNSYVTTNTAANAPPTPAGGYVAFIVSTLGPGQQMPDCSQVVINAGGPTIANGIVRGVTAGFSFTQRVSASSDRMEIYIGATASGDASGRDLNNLTTIDYAYGLWSQLQPRLAIFYLENSVTPSGGDTFGAQDFALLDTQGQNASLIIETDPVLIKANPANLKNINLSGPLYLSAATTFQNVNINGSNNVINAYKPLSFRHTTLNGPNGNTPINVYGTDLMINDSSLQYVNVYATNSHVSFLNDANVPATTFLGYLVANNANITFEAIPSGSGGAAVPATFTLKPSAAIVLSATSSNITIGSPTGAATTVAPTGQFALNSGNLTVNANGILQPTLQNNVPITMYNGSINVIGTYNANVTGDPALLAVGSAININGTFNANPGTGGGMYVSATTLSGTGNIAVHGNGNYCIQYIGPGNLNIPLYPAATANSAFPSFNTIKTGNALGYTSPYYDTNYVVPTLTPGSGTDPLITGGSAVAPDLFISGLGTSGNFISPNTTYLDPITFEAGVRSIFTHEFFPGLNVYFSGNCN